MSAEVSSLAAGPVPQPPPLPAAAAGAPVVKIRPRTGWKPIHWRELWQFRELLLLLALRDIKVRYKQTALGVVWAVLQPVMTMMVFTLFFGRLGGFEAKTPSGVPYPVFVFCALLPWQLFSFALTQSSNSVVAEQRLLTKVYFPRLIIPLTPVLSALVDFGIGLVLLLGLMLLYGVVPTAAVLLLPLFILFAVMVAMAVGLWLSALNAIYRDVRYTIPFLTQFWLFATPIAYPLSIVPPQWQGIYGLNPMVGVVEGFRWALLGLGQPPWEVLGVSAAVVGILLVGGLFFFRRMERIFADVV
jgi:lipopolysaccharide transport system permease protein